MSKFNSISNAEKDAVVNVLIQNIIKTKNDFNEEQIEPETNYDLRQYNDGSNIYYPYVFSKTLEHDAVLGLPLKTDVDLLLKAIKTGKQTDIDNINQSVSSTRRLENIIADKSFNLIGLESSLANMTTHYDIDSERSMFEMSEVYIASLKRDDSFFSFESLTLADPYITTLNNFTDKSSAPVDMGNITGKLLLRGGYSGCEIGAFISQFLYLDFKYGNLDIEQKYNVENDYELSSDLTEWRAIQNGVVNGSVSTQATKLYVHSPRVLGSIVHNDPLYQFYYNAALICLQNGIAPEAYQHPKNSNWTSGGGPFILAHVANVAKSALLSAWYLKHQVNMKIRPEVLAQRIELAYTNPTALADCPGLSEIKTIADANMSVLLGDIITANASNTRLLKSMFPEGSPTHGSEPAGHAIVASACTTLLKALFLTVDGNDNDILWNIPVVHSTDGLSLVSYPNSTVNMTINGELNKLAVNISQGRDQAGVHYRSDAPLEVGEQVAISYLKSIVKTVADEGFVGWKLRKYDGSLITIAP